MNFTDHTWVVALNTPNVPEQVRGLAGIVRGVALEIRRRGPGSLAFGLQGDPIGEGSVYVVLFPDLPYPHQVYESWLRAALPAEIPEHHEGIAALAHRGNWLDRMALGESPAPVPTAA